MKDENSKFLTDIRLNDRLSPVLQQLQLSRRRILTSRRPRDERNRLTFNSVESPIKSLPLSWPVYLFSTGPRTISRSDVVFFTPAARSTKNHFSLPKTDSRLRHRGYFPNGDPPFLPVHLRRPRFCTMHQIGRAHV